MSFYADGTDGAKVLGMKVPCDSLVTCQGLLYPGDRPQPAQTTLINWPALQGF